MKNIQTLKCRIFKVKTFYFNFIQNIFQFGELIGRYYHADTHVVFGGDFLAVKQSIQTEIRVSVGLMTAVDAGHSSGAEDLLRASWIIRSCSKRLSFWCC